LFLRGKFFRVTDYFALLAQPHRPWLDLEKLEEKYRELARQTHPDQSDRGTNEFAEINEAYRTLRDPKSRLQHLLALKGHSLAISTTEVPADLADLFMKIAPALTRKDKNALDILSQELGNHYDKAIRELYGLNQAWSENRLDDAENLYRRFAFLTRWKNLVEEQQFNAAIR
jgi:molecular chaperone HscB